MRSRDLAGRAAAVATQIVDDEALRWLDAAVGRLRARLRHPVPGPLRAWADDLADDGGDTPLLGLGRRAPRFEALHWNGARHPADPLVVTALLVAAADADPIGLGCALAAGEAVLAVSRAAGQPGPAVAGTAVLGCAVVATLVADPPGDDLADTLERVLDVAASLMVLTAVDAPEGAERVRLMRAGHPAAAGWLAARAVTAGLVGMSDAPAATLATLHSGFPGGVAAPGVRHVGDLLAALS